LQALNTRAQEIAYEKSLQQSEVVFHNEKTRQFRLQILLLENRNEDLHAQLSTDDECIEELMNYCKEVEARLELAGDSLQSTQSDLRVKSREVETLKVGKDPKLRCASGMLIIS
jgi:chromosome segregation ATPase